ncbi:MAG: NAD-dependent epimerase/dehydratase family protein [Aeoliella sp.]
MPAKKMLVTGSSGMVGRHVVRRAVEAGYQVRGLVQDGHDSSPIDKLDVEIIYGDLTKPETVPAMIEGVDVIVHTAGMVGDWGPMEEYRAINQDAVETLLEAVRQQETPIARFVHISSLGVYRWGDHYGEDETVPPDYVGYDGYTTTKAQAELICQRYIDEYQLPVVMIRPGFMYGEGDRHVLPRVVETLRAGTMMMIGDGKKVLDNLYVGNLADAVLLAVENPRAIGQIYNIRDERLVDRNEYIGAVCQAIGAKMPRRAPCWLARRLIRPLALVAKLIGKQGPPLVTKPRYKFMALNLEYSIDKAKRELGYVPRVDFQEGIPIALAPYVRKEPTTSSPVIASS